MSAGVSARQPIELIADAGPEAGWGHVSRSSGLAAALASRRVPIRRRGFGIEEPIERDGMKWVPLGADALASVPDGATVWLDTYRLPLVEVEALAARARLCVMYDGVAGPPRNAELVVSVGAAPRKTDDRRWLSGPAYACLRQSFWGAAERELSETVRSILITTGAEGRLAAELAAAIREATAVERVTLVRGPLDTAGTETEEVDVLAAPDSLFDPLSQADLAVTAGGQTMLEAASLGTPCIALASSDDQRGQINLLAKEGAVLPVDPPSADVVRRLVSELVADSQRRQTMSRASQRTVDGLGALRVASAMEVIAKTPA